MSGGGVVRLSSDCSVCADAVLTKARVQAAAEPGTALADGATQRLAGSAIAVGLVHLHDEP